jgi:hypothetical protein
MTETGVSGLDSSGVKRIAGIAIGLGKLLRLKPSNFAAWLTEEVYTGKVQPLDWPLPDTHPILALQV